MSKLTEAQQRAKKTYKAKLKRFTVDFCPSEDELWEHLQAQDNKQGYIKRLIRQDKEKDGN